MAKKSGYRLGRRLKASAKDRRDYITYLNSARRLPGQRDDTRIITMLYSQSNGAGSIGYSSFPDDKYGDLKGPQPLATNDLQALIALPGGGNYAVFDGDAVNTLKSKRLNLGDDSVKVIEANSLSFNEAQGRTQVFFSGTVLTLEDDVEYPVSIAQIQTRVITARFGLEGGVRAKIADYTRQTLTARFGLGGEAKTRVAVMHSLKAVMGLGGAMRGNIFPPVTIRPAMDLGGAMKTNLVRKIALKARYALGGETQANVGIGAWLKGAHIDGGGALAATIIKGVRVPFAGIDGGGEVYALPELGPPPDTGGGGDGSAEAEGLFGGMDVQPTAARKDADTAFITALKNAGVWDKLDALFVFKRPVQQQAMVNWVNPANKAVSGGGLQFTANSGFKTYDGGFLHNNYNPGDGGEYKYKATDATFFAYGSQRWHDGTSPNSFGGHVGNGYGTYMNQYADYNMYNVITGGSVNALVNTGFDGLFALNRSAVNSCKLLKKGAVIAHDTSVQAAGVPNAVMFMLGYNIAGVARETRKVDVPLIGWGASLTDAQHLAFSNAVEEYLALATG